MTYETEFVQISLDELLREAAVMKAEGWRFIQTHAVNTDSGIDLYYSFMKNGLVRNYKIIGVTKDMQVPSITSMFLAAFVFENEARELFGVDMKDIAIDFKGAMYAPAESEPMTFISPEQKAAREKAAMVASKSSCVGPSDTSDDTKSRPSRVFVMTPERRARLDAKLATMSPEKVAKVEAALKAREAEAAQALAAPVKPENDAIEPPKDDKATGTPDSSVGEESNIDMVLEEKISQMDPAKAAKVRKALARLNGAIDELEPPAAAPAIELSIDAQVAAKLSMMDPEKAEKVRAVLLGKAARELKLEGGE